MVLRESFLIIVFIIIPFSNLPIWAAPIFWIAKRTNSIVTTFSLLSFYRDLDYKFQVVGLLANRFQYALQTAK